MTEETTEAAADTTLSEKEVLMQRAKLMGISFSNNISAEKLREKIDAHLAGEAESQEEAAAEPEVNPLASPEAKKASLREQLIAEATKLIRVRITNLDPKKKDLPGEIITVANEYIGTIRKFVPFGEHTDDGYHIPKCIYNLLEDRRFLSIRVVRDRRTGVTTPVTTWAKEFALEVLPQLTEEELKDLAAAQMAAGSVE